MLKTAIITGCRKTFSGDDKDFPCYIKETADSILASDIPLETITIYLDTLQGRKLDQSYLDCLSSIPIRIEENKGGGIIENVKEVFVKNKDNPEEYLLLMEDDIIVKPDIYSKAIQFLLDYKVDFGSLYDVFPYRSKPIPTNEFWGGQALILKTKDLMFYRDNLNNEYGKYPDIQLSRIAGNKLGYEIRAKGLVQHIGKVSAHGNDYHKTNVW
jgi:hypothetical protein